MREPFALSDAIRIGAAIRPQAFHGLFYNGRSCAMGAAAEAVAGRCETPDPLTSDDYKRLQEMEFALFGRYEIIFQQSAGCPACTTLGLRAGRRDLYGLIIHLNDEHRWTREAIADFVVQVEEQIGYETITEQSESLSSTVLSVGV